MLIATCCCDSVPVVVAVVAVAVACVVGSGATEAVVAGDTCVSVSFADEWPQPARTRHAPASAA